MSGDEVQALQGIFCGPGEFKLMSNSTTGDAECIFCIHVSCETSGQTSINDQSEDSTEISLQCLLPIGYPHILPEISLDSQKLTKHSTNQLREALYEHANELLGQPMIMDLVYWVKDNARFFLAPSNVQSTKEELGATDTKGAIYTAILHIDHMRSRVKYVKILVSWATGLSLTGRLLFYHHLILILLLGNEHSIKDFLVKLRTQKVDVDSSGRSCKERMMTIVMQGPHPRCQSSKRKDDVQICDCSTLSDVEDVFKDLDLMDVYETTVAPEFKLLQPSIKLSNAR